MDLPNRFESISQADTFAEYRRGLVDRLWTFGVSIGSVLAAFYLERSYARGLPPRDPARTTPDERSFSAVVLGAFYWFALLFVFAYAQLETHRALGLLHAAAPARADPAVGGDGGLFPPPLSGRRKIPSAAGAVRLPGGGHPQDDPVDLDSWDLGSRWFFRAEYNGLSVAMRWLDFAGSLALLAAGWRWLAGPGEARNLARVFGYGGLALLFFFATLEVRSLLHAVEPAFIAGGTSVLWSLFAVAFLVAGHASSRETAAPDRPVPFRRRRDQGVPGRPGRHAHDVPRASPSWSSACSCWAAPSPISAPAHPSIRRIRDDAAPVRSGPGVSR
jgi:hypothetical protein